MSRDPALLIKAAAAAADNAYAPYSGFQVGAALLLDDDEIITAANFENASYGLSLCAETIAIAKAASEGKLGQILAIAVAGGTQGEIGKQRCAPCGRCRQIIKEAAEVAARDIAVHVAHGGGYDSYVISELLPYAFGPENLNPSEN